MPGGATTYDVAAKIGSGLARAAIAGRILDGGRGQVIDLHRHLPTDCTLSILTRSDDDAHALFVLRHSAAHVMAEAICSLFPETKLVYGPPLEDGFYYDIDLPRSITPEDFPRLESQMKRIVKEDRRFCRLELNRADGMAKLAAKGNRYKIDNAERADGDALSFYVTGENAGTDFEDLCLGPHVPSTGVIKAFTIKSVSRSFYRGDVNDQPLQRIYGTAFFKKQSLEEYLERLEEAKKRDHRVLGKQLGLFHIDEAVGPGLILWMPKGAIIRQELQTFITAELNKQGYQQVFTPHIGKIGLYRTSGHFPYYQDSQYPPLITHQQMGRLASKGCTCADLANRLKSGDCDAYLLKPMNCPHHIKIYSAEPRSYRDLPVRLAEFGTVYRWEQSGEVNGLTRVRGMTQDDAHIFCTEEQLADELMGCLSIVKTIFATLQMADYRVRVGLRDRDSAKYTGDAAGWEAAERACRDAAASLGVPFKEERGEAAFYGPKIDFIAKDVLGREWQLGTVQVDYNLPVRFDLSYIGADNTPHRPVMIHRAPFGSMVRFVGVLIEHFAGAFPLWLSPVQAAVASVSEKSAEYAQRVFEQLKAAGLRAELDVSDEKIGPKKHRLRTSKVNYILVVGESEAGDGSVNVNDRSGGNFGNMSLEAFVSACRDEIEGKSITSNLAASTAAGYP